MGWISELTATHWFLFGLMLMGLEVFIPSAILLWPGIAAMFVGGVAFVTPDTDPQFLIIVWAVFSVFFALGAQIYKRRFPENKDAPTMNRRGDQYIGRHFTLAKDIVNGGGELHIDDTRWKIVSTKDLSAGVKVKVTAVEGTSLRVEEFLS